MSIFTTLSLDLEDNVASRVRRDFYFVLEAFGFDKVGNVTTTWVREFDDDAVLNIQRAVIREVRIIAAACDVKSFEGALQVGNSRPIMFDEVEPKMPATRRLVLALRRK
jgi:hypothetical protein